MSELSLEFLEIGNTILLSSICVSICIIFLLISYFIGQIIGFLIEKTY